MNFFEALKSVLKNVLQFKGRSSRSEYNYWMVFLFFIFLFAIEIDPPNPISSTSFNNGDIENKRINEIIEATESAGSLCTRLMGAGGVGFFVCWAPPEKHEAIKQSVNVRTWVNVDISNVGSQVIFSEK